MRVLRLNHALRFSVEEGRPPCHQEALKSFKLFQAAHPFGEAHLRGSFKRAEHCFTVSIIPPLTFSLFFPFIWVKNKGELTVI